MGPRGPVRWCCGPLVSLLFLDVAIAHPTGFQDIQDRPLVVGALSSSPQNTAPQLLGAITLAILVASLLVCRRSRRRLVRDRSTRGVTPSGGRPDVLSSRL